MTTEEPDLRALRPDAVTAVEERLLADAAALSRDVRDRRQETERLGRYPSDIHERLRAAGLYRALTPKRFGGHQISPGAFLNISRMLARACPSTGWMYCLGATHSLAAATLLPLEAQEEVFANADFISPASIVPSGGATHATRGWHIEGKWSYCSGAPYATHMMGHAIVTADSDACDAGTPVMFVAPRSKWTLVDDWRDSFGLRGSGSNSIHIDAVLPDHLVLPGHLSETPMTEARVRSYVHPHKQYQGGQLAYMSLEGAALALGIAQAAQDEYEVLLATRTTLLPPTVPRHLDPDYQRWHGEASGLLDTAAFALDGALAEWERLAGIPDPERRTELSIASVARQIIDLCWKAVETYIYPTAGSSASRRGSALEGVWRDMSMLRTHAGFSVFSPTVGARTYSGARMRTAAAALSPELS